MARASGQGYQDSLDQVDRNHHYEPAEAVALLKKTSRRELRRDRRGPHPARGQRPPRRRAAPRHPGAPNARRPRRHRRRLRRGRQGARPRPGPSSSAPATSPASRPAWTDFDLVIATDQMPKVGASAASSARRARCRTPRSAPSPTTSPRPSRRPSRARSSTGPTARPSSTSLDRQGFIRRAGAARELRRGDRRDRSRQAGLKGAHHLDHAGDHDGPRHPRRLLPHPRGGSWPSGRSRRRRRLGRATPARRGRSHRLAPVRAVAGPPRRSRVRGDGAVQRRERRWTTGLTDIDAHSSTAGAVPSSRKRPAAG